MPYELKVGAGEVYITVSATRELGWGSEYRENPNALVVIHEIEQRLKDLLEDMVKPRSLSVDPKATDTGKADA